MVSRDEFQCAKYLTTQPKWTMLNSTSESGFNFRIVILLLHLSLPHVMICWYMDMIEFYITVSVNTLNHMAHIKRVIINNWYHIFMTQVYFWLSRTPFWWAEFEPYLTTVLECFARWRLLLNLFECSTSNYILYILYVSHCILFRALSPNGCTSLTFQP